MERASEPRHLHTSVGHRRIVSQLSRHHNLIVSLSLTLLFVSSSEFETMPTEEAFHTLPDGRKLYAKTWKVRAEQLQELS